METYGVEGKHSFYHFAAITLQAGAGAYGRIVGYTGPQWRRDAKSEIKGWGVRTCIVDKVMERDGEVNECVFRTFNAAAECKDFTVFAFTRSSGTNTFTASNAGASIPSFVPRAHTADGKRTFRLDPPLRYKKGQYLGLTSRSTSLNICSISGTNIKAEEKGELETTELWYEGSGITPGSTVTLTSWKGTLALGFGRVQGDGAAAGDRGEGLGLTGPQWGAAKSEIKGWGVRTCIIKKPLGHSGTVKRIKLRSFNGGTKATGFEVYAFTKTGNNKFTVRLFLSISCLLASTLNFSFDCFYSFLQAGEVRGKIDEFTSTHKGERTLQLNPPVPFKKGQ